MRHTIHWAFNKRLPHKQNSDTKQRIWNLGKEKEMNCSKRHFTKGGAIILSCSFMPDYWPIREIVSKLKAGLKYVVKNFACLILMFFYLICFDSTSGFGTWSSSEYLLVNQRYLFLTGQRNSISYQTVCFHKWSKAVVVTQTFLTRLYLDWGLQAPGFTLVLHAGVKTNWTERKLLVWLKVWFHPWGAENKRSTDDI